MKCRNHRLSVRASSAPAARFLAKRLERDRVVGDATAGQLRRRRRPCHDDQLLDHHRAPSRRPVRSLPHVWARSRKRVASPKRQFEIWVLGAQSPREQLPARHTSCRATSLKPFQRQIPIDTRCQISFSSSHVQWPFVCGRRVGVTPPFNHNGRPFSDITVSFLAQTNGTPIRVNPHYCPNR